MTLYRRHQQAQMIDSITKFWMSDKNADVGLEIRRAEPGRTEGQQAKLHSIIREIAIQGGCGESWLKQSVLKRNCEDTFPFWPTRPEKNRQGDTVLVPKSESRLSKKEESELIERLYVFASEWGIEMEAY